VILAFLGAVLVVGNGRRYDSGIGFSTGFRDVLGCVVVVVIDAIVVVVVIDAIVVDTRSDFLYNGAGTRDYFLKKIQAILYDLGGVKVFVIDFVVHLLVLVFRLNCFRFVLLGRLILFLIDFSLIFLFCFILEELLDVAFTFGSKFFDFCDGYDAEQGHDAVIGFVHLEDNGDEYDLGNDKKEDGDGHDDDEGCFELLDFVTVEVVESI
jgi:hypothetical protein